MRVVTQWRSLLARLAPRFHVFAPDSWGSGRGAPWPSVRQITLADEVALIWPVLALAIDYWMGEGDWSACRRRASLPSRNR